MMNGESILQKVSAMTEQTTELIQQIPFAKLFAHLKSTDLWRYAIVILGVAKLLIYSYLYTSK